ncbi:hypothetical protein DSL92_00170 [Billgrantia gudaonensis]|uniref:Uncharacterized protein n=1 Tax=Billgrantia gudaonensis TaxID=376427 RepID=A0A3S0R5K7_9GAMM|nr:hypothetical protein DSL92_00170 [Halomonas gudaonensis]
MLQRCASFGILALVLGLQLLEPFVQATQMSAQPVRILLPLIAFGFDGGQIGTAGFQSLLNVGQMLSQRRFALNGIFCLALSLLRGLLGCGHLPIRLLAILAQRFVGRFLGVLQTRSTNVATLPGCPGRVTHRAFRRVELATPSGVR